MRSLLVLVWTFSCSCSDLSGFNCGPILDFDQLPKKGVLKLNNSIKLNGTITLKVGGIPTGGVIEFLAEREDTDYDNQLNNGSHDENPAAILRIEFGRKSLNLSSRIGMVEKQFQLIPDKLENSSFTLQLLGRFVCHLFPLFE